MHRSGTNETFEERIHSLRQTTLADDTLAHKSTTLREIHSHGTHKHSTLNEIHLAVKENIAKLFHIFKLKYSLHELH